MKTMIVIRRMMELGDETYPLSRSTHTCHPWLSGYGLDRPLLSLGSTPRDRGHPYPPSRCPRHQQSPSRTSPLPIHVAAAPPKVTAPEKTIPKYCFQPRSHRMVCVRPERTIGTPARGRQSYPIRKRKQAHNSDIQKDDGKRR